jgi:hypothetical protein
LSAGLPEILKPTKVTIDDAESAKLLTPSATTPIEDMRSPIVIYIIVTNILTTTPTIPAR